MTSDGITIAPVVMPSRAVITSVMRTSSMGMEALNSRGSPDRTRCYAAKTTKNFLIRSWISQVAFHPIGKKAADPASRVSGVTAILSNHHAPFMDVNHFAPVQKLPS